ncbi:MAG: YeeE/YedE family protein [Chitinophagales bacterium]|nr:YeeE/YedE family protein [Chitinophagales bacterium]
MQSIREEEGTNHQQQTENFSGNIKYILAGIFFGIVFVKAEIVSWFRIQEMFRLASFHMYGVIGTAVVVATISTFLIKKFKIKTIQGEEVIFSERPLDKGNIIGGLLFGFGWALTGACPGPLYGLLGSGFAVFVVAILSAVAGTYAYGLLREKLPH